MSMMRGLLFSVLSLSLALVGFSGCSNEASAAFGDPHDRVHPERWKRHSKKRSSVSSSERSRLPGKEMLRATAKLSVADDLQDAAKADARARDEALDDLRDAILARKSGVKKFASRVTNFSMQFNCTMKGKSYCRRQIELKFEHHLISKKELEEEIQATIDGYVADLETNDNRLLVAARADLESFPRVAVPEVDVPDSLAGPHTQGVMRTLKKSNERMVVASVAGELTSLFVARIMMTTARRGVARGGAATVGASGAGMTLGASLAAGLAVELLFYVFDDSEKKIRKRAEKAMDDLAVLVVEGDEETSGLRDVLKAMARDRQEARKLLLLRGAIERGIK